MKLLLTLAPGLEFAAHGDLLVVDWESKTVLDALRYQHQFYEESHKGFAGAKLHNNYLIVSMEVELLEFELAPLKLKSSHSFNFLNDAHDIEVTDDRIWVCNSGLDSVEEFDLNWNHLNCHDMIKPFGRRPAHVWKLMRQDLKRSWKRLTGNYTYYSYLHERAPFRNVKKLIWPNFYRQSGKELRYTDFRPHFLHPNHLTKVGDDIWITLYGSGQIVSLKSQKVIAEGLGHPHDGVIVDDRLLITDCLNHRVIIYEFDVNHQKIGKLIMSKELSRVNCGGFVRGIVCVDGQVLVGLTAKRGAAPSDRFARIAQLCPKTLELLDRWQVPIEFGNSVFSIVDVTTNYSNYGHTTR